MKFFWALATDWPVGTIVSIIVCVAVLYGLTWIADIAGSRADTLHVTVVEKSYTASSTGVGVGPSFSGSGGGAVVVTSNPEKHTLFVQREGGEPFPVNVDHNTWLRSEKGKVIDLEVRIGWITGNILD